MVRLPLAGRLIPVITDEYADPDFGSGAVKITGAHDFNDYEVAKRNDIPMYSLMDERGAMCESEIMPAKYVGMDRFKARKAVVADIDAEGFLIAVEDKKIMQPYGDRSGVVIEPMLTDQWFVAADKLAVEAMAKVDDGSTRFIPENWKKTYDHWMKDIQPWCISRQLWWGHQIPAYYGPVRLADEIQDNEFVRTNNKKIFVALNPDEFLNQVVDYYSAEEGVVVEEFDHVSDNYIRVSFYIDGKPEYLFTVTISRDPDVLDTWFSSGLWPFSTLGWPENTDELERFYPTSTLVTAFDIIFFWVARMMMQGLHFMDEVPFDDVYIHALVLDEQGKKLSLIHI